MKRNSLSRLVLLMVHSLIYAAVAVYIPCSYSESHEALVKVIHPCHQPHNIKTFFNNEKVLNATTDETRLKLKRLFTIEVKGGVITRNLYHFARLYEQLSIIFLKKTSNYNFIRYLATGAIEKVSRRPLLQAFISLCKQHSGITVKEMLALATNAKCSHYGGDNNIQLFLALFDEQTSTVNRAITKNTISPKTSPRKRKYTHQHQHPDDEAGIKRAKHTSSNSNGWSSSLLQLATAWALPILGLGSPCHESIEASEHCDGYHDGDCEGEEETVRHCCKGGTDSIDLNTHTCTNTENGKTWGVCDDKTYVVNPRDQCDGIPGDCPDWSDDIESHCCRNGTTTLDSTTKMPMCQHIKNPRRRLGVCPDSTTIKPISVCDGTDDCGEFADEKAENCCGGAADPDTGFCKSVKGGERRFVCHNPQHNGTILEHKRCNSDNDCGDNSDEQASYCCQGGNAGINSDTKLCNRSNAPRRKAFACPDAHVIPIRQACDGTEDCPDGADEINCCKNDSYDADSRFCDKAIGEGQWYRCTFDNFPISTELLCDGKWDCQYGGDESQEQCCANDMEPNTRLCDKKNGEGQYFVCHSQNVIDESKRCDGTAHCPTPSGHPADAEDEHSQFCPPAPSNSPSATSEPSLITFTPTTDENGIPHIQITKATLDVTKADLNASHYSAFIISGMVIIVYVVAMASKCRQNCKQYHERPSCSNLAEIPFSPVTQLARFSCKHIGNCLNFLGIRKQESTTHVEYQHQLMKEEDSEQ